MAVLDLTNGLASVSSDLGITGYPFTIALWIRRTGDHSTPGFAAEFGDGGSFHAVGVTAFEYLTMAARYNNSTIDIASYATTTMSLNTWVPVVLRVTSSSQRDLYKGALTAVKQDTTNIGGFDTETHPVEKFSLGDGYGSDPFLGIVAHVAVWDKALTDGAGGEIDTFMEGGNPLAIANTNLRAYYDGSNDGSTTWSDVSGNGYDLTISGATIDTTTTEPTVDDPPSTATPGITITGIKEPNEVDTLITSVINARVRAWYGVSPDDTLAPSQTLTDQSITAGELEVTLSSASVDDSVILSVNWDAGGGETKFFRYTGTVIDLDAT